MKDLKQILSNKEKIVLTAPEPKPEPSIQDLMSEYETVETPEPEPEKNGQEFQQQHEFQEEENKTIGGSLLTGAMVITLIDNLAPILVTILHTKIIKSDTRLTRQDFQRLKLTTAQKKELEPICEEVVSKMDFEADPMIVLIFTVVASYGLNYMALIDQKEEEKRKTKTMDTILKRP